MRLGILISVSCIGTMLPNVTAQESKPVTVEQILQRAELEAEKITGLENRVKAQIEIAEIYWKIGGKTRSQEIYIECLNLSTKENDVFKRISLNDSILFSQAITGDPSAVVLWIEKRLKDNSDKDDLLSAVVEQYCDNGKIENLDDAIRRISYSNLRKTSYAKLATAQLIKRNVEEASQTLKLVSDDNIPSIFENAFYRMDDSLDYSYAIKAIKLVRSRSQRAKILIQLSAGFYSVGEKGESRKTFGLLSSILKKLPGNGVVSTSYS